MTTAIVLFIILLVLGYASWVLFLITAAQKEVAPVTQQSSAVQLQVKDRPIPAAPKTWGPAITLASTHGKRSCLFTITGKQQRLTFINGIGDSSLYVYVIPEGKSLDQEGGFPEVMAEDTTGGTMLYKAPGNYYLPYFRVVKAQFQTREQIVSTFARPKLVTKPVTKRPAKQLAISMLKALLQTLTLGQQNQERDRFTNHY